jgi:hypothetical protein
VAVGAAGFPYLDASTAVRLGHRYLETDVHATADGHLLAFHDTHLDRVADATGAVADLPYAAVREGLPRRRCGPRRPGRAAHPGLTRGIRRPSGPRSRLHQNLGKCLRACVTST